ncbi:MAG TPA: hypothetical protein VFL94_15355, partial [Actinomycetales bacterium]|nr:hypothetical protein [Actinomycetales bacterium]
MGWEDGWKDFELADRSAYRARLLQELAIEPSRTAVVTIDMQYNYLDPSIGGLPVLPETAEHVVRSTERLLDEARSRGIPRLVELDRRRPPVGERPRGLAAGEAERVSLGRRVEAQQAADGRCAP